MTTFCKFNLDCAHTLPMRPKNERVHGHTYHVQVYVRNKCDIQDLLDDCQEKVISQLDHRMLNDVIEEPTSEAIAEWIYKALHKTWEVNSVVVERDIGGAIYK